MTNDSGEGKGGGAYLKGGTYFEFHIQQGGLIEGGHLFEEIRYTNFGLLLSVTSLFIIILCLIELISIINVYRY